MGPEGIQQQKEGSGQEHSRLSKTLQVATLLTASLPGMSLFGAGEEQAAGFDPKLEAVPAVQMLRVDTDPVDAEPAPVPAVVTQEELDQKVKAVEVLLQEAIKEYNVVLALYPNREGPLLESPVDSFQTSMEQLGTQGTLNEQYQGYTDLGSSIATWKGALIEYQQDEVLLTGIRQELQDSTLIPFSYRVAEDRSAVEVQRQKAEALWKAADPAYVAALDSTQEQLRAYRQSFIASRTEVRELYRNVQGLEKTLDTIEQKSPYADDVAVELAAARDLLQQVENTYRKGDESFFSTAREAQVAVAHVEDAVIEAENYQHYGQYALWAAGILGTLGFGVLLSAKSKAGKANKEAASVLQKEKESVEQAEQKFLNLYERAEDVYFDFDAHEYAGLTLGASERYTRAMGDVLAHIGKLQETHAEAKQDYTGQNILRRIGNGFTKSGALKAVARFTEERSYSPATAASVNLYGRSEDGYALRFPPRVKDVSGTAAESKQAIEQGLKKAEEILQEFLEKEEALETSLKQQAEALDVLRHDHHKLLSHRSGILAFRIGEDTKRAVKGLLQKSQELKRIAARDPLRAYQYASVMEKRTHALQALTAVCIEGAYDCGVDIDRGRKALEAGGAQTSWISDKLSFLSSMSHEAVPAALRGEETGHELIRKELHALEQRVYDTIAVQERLAESEQEFVVLLEELVPLQELLAERFDTDIETLFEQDSMHVGALTQEITEQYALVQTCLNSGDQEGAREAQEEATVQLRRLTAAVGILRDTLKEFEEVSTSRKGTQTELENLLKNYRKEVSELHELFDDAAFVMGKGDSSHPVPEKTLDNYLDDTEQAIQLAETAMTDAETAFESGQLIRARQIMEHVFSLHEVAYSRFDEIFVKDDRLKRQHSINVKNVTELRSIADAVDRQIEHDLVPASTIADVKRLREKLTEFVDYLQLDSEPDTGTATGLDPESLREDVLELAQEYRNIQHAVLESRFTKAEAEKSVKGLFEFLSHVEEELLLDETHFEDKRAFARICTQQAALEKQVAGVHQEWRDIERKAVTLYLEAVAIFGRTVGEEEVADDVCETLNRALEKRAELLSWQGEFGVRVRGTPGAEPFESALVNITQGNLFAADFDAKQTLSAIEEASRIAKDHVAQEQRKHEARLLAFEAEKELRFEQERRKQEVLSHDWSEQDQA